MVFWRGIGIPRFPSIVMPRFPSKKMWDNKYTDFENLETSEES